MSLRTACSWMFFLQDGELGLLLRQLPLPLCPAGLACPVVLLPHPPVLLLLRQILHLNPSPPCLLCLLLHLYFLHILHFHLLDKEVCVASSTSSGKAKLAIWVSSMIHLSRSSVSFDSTLLLLLLLLLLLATLTGSSILPSASTAGRQSPRLASSKPAPAHTVSALLLGITSTSVFCSVMCRVVVGKGSGSVKSNEAFSIISIMFVVSSGRGTVFFSIVRISTSSPIIFIGAVLVL